MIGGGKGWWGESYRHYLASKRVKTIGPVSRFLELRRTTRAERMGLADVQVPAREKLAYRRAMARPLTELEKEQALRRLRFGVFADIPERQKKLEQQIISATKLEGTLQPGISGTQVSRVKKELEKSILEMSPEDRAKVGALLEEYGRLRETYPAEERKWFANVALYGQDVVRNPEAYEKKIPPKVEKVKAKPSVRPPKKRVVEEQMVDMGLGTEQSREYGEGGRLRFLRQLKSMIREGRAARMTTDAVVKVKEERGAFRVKLKKGEYLVRMVKESGEGTEYNVVKVGKTGYSVRTVVPLATEFDTDV